MTDNEFFMELIDSFPIIKPDIELEDIDMIHMRMEIFASYTNKLIEEDDIQEVTRCFNFLELRTDSMSDELINALNVSYCEALLLGENAYNMESIVKIMPTKLSVIYLGYKRYYEWLTHRGSNC
ncbi:hypothetical protein [Pedobacter frigoris]|uniref:DUF7674 family protein n=1 Tax=Pedobacter frigoris TaxID=2571272 RepID=UPI00292FA9EC|nr:hypothetical protein [Pedobacter frigoris]